MYTTGLNWPMLILNLKAAGNKKEINVENNWNILKLNDDKRDS